MVHLFSSHNGKMYPIVLAAKDNRASTRSRRRALCVSFAFLVLLQSPATTNNVVEATHALNDADNIPWVLAPNHESFKWRQEAGRPAPTMKKVVLWTRHDKIGIGNALGGFARVFHDALMEDRTLVVRETLCTSASRGVRECDSNSRTAHHTLPHNS
jgi:hypothetical protein